jgi:hypothetical protein
MARTSNRIVWRIPGALFLGIAFLALAGCQSKGTVKGKVTFKNSPMPKGTTVLFRHVSSDHVVTANVSGDDGSYRCEGVPVGECQIAVQPPTGPNIGGQGPMDRASVMAGKGTLTPKMEGAKDMVGPPPGMFDVFNKDSDTRKTVQIPPKYKDPESSGLTFTVKSGKNEHDIVVPEG